MTLSTDCIDHGCKGYGMGYATAWIKLPNGEKIPTTKHRRVHYEATGELPEVVRHTCDNPRCINPEHLIGGTQVDNMQDCVKRGRHSYGVVRGVANPTCKVDYPTVQYMRANYIKGSRTNGLRALGERFGIGISHVFRIVNGEVRLNV